ncbi:hypothetical protein NDS46_30285 (plasmid) [Paenibacillus thiaminolyticus]|uniref:hypothetical protein n=1 Tax=Paenibacillus thiaminolyticus TaxID=49283 RepID=UPI00232AF0D7|nr:hypothetical protein [Paenibacillus thiaminolyticus]WCF11637.1 hypothetical protein NDS46_30285 [Paenibacillus thiaminolyticus]
MIITKDINNVSGYIEYSLAFEEPVGSYNANDNDEKDECFESDTFYSLQEFIEKISIENLNRIKESSDARDVWVSHISFKGKSEDGVTTADLNMSLKSNSGHVGTKLESEDIDNRLLLNLNKMKEILDNTLEGHPIKY